MKNENNNKTEKKFEKYFQENIENIFKEYKWKRIKFSGSIRAVYLLENKENENDVIFIKQIKIIFEEQEILKEIKEILKEKDINNDKEMKKENDINKYIIRKLKKIYKEKIDKEMQKGNKNISDVILKEKISDQVILEIIKKKLEEINLNTLKEIYFLVLFTQSKENYFSKLNEIKIFDDKKYVFLLFRENKFSLNMLMETIYLEDEILIKNIIFYICLELYYLYSNNIIHNDIKPSNILIGNESPCTSLCDFGAMRYEGEISDEYTIFYVAPEFLYNNGRRNNKSDMWSLGIIMIEMFYTKYILELIKKVKKEELLSKLDEKEKINLFLELGIKKEYYSSEEEENQINYEKIKEIVKDEKAFHLIEKLVVFNPDKRYNAEEALKSDYFIDIYKGDKFDKLEKLKTYDKINKLKDVNDFIEIIKELDSKLKEFNKLDDNVN